MAGMRTHLAELMKLPTAERLKAANLLWESVETSSEYLDWEAHWGIELSSRLHGLTAGSREPIDAATAFAKARDRLKG